MMLAAQIACGLVAVQHVGILILEMFLWRKPLGRKVFGLTQKLADESAPLAMNQGLYNGFLATGLFWALATPWAVRTGGAAQTLADLTGQPSATIDGRCLGLFFLGCVVVAGIFGGLTAKRSIIVVQGLPASIGFALTWSA